LIMVNINIELGKKIRELRRKKNITQEELAHRAELDFSYINQIENGKRNPSIEAIAKIARGLGVKAQSLLTF
jgi:transcriptional regulator with XRE-family HTH domain